MPTLISFSGLPGVGKTTIARALAAEIDAFYLRIDSIENALKNSTLAIHPAADAGYRAVAAIAKDNLALRKDVIADTVNPIAITRQWLAEAATSTGARLLDIEVICSDTAEHRRRIETRRSDLDGHTLHDWQRVQERQYDAWTTPRLTLDTAKLSATDCVKNIIAALNSGA